jgi:hypothetical protein
MLNPKIRFRFKTEILKTLLACTHNLSRFLSALILSIIAFVIMSLSITTFGTMILRIMTFSISTSEIKHHV